jgi:hypothetical protein
LSMDYGRDVKYKIIISALCAVIIVFVFIFVWNYFSARYFDSKAIPTCGDGSFYDTCDLNKPYYCSEGVLTENASVCGCPAGMNKSGNSCISQYQTGPKEIMLKYTLRGEGGEINFTVYKGLADYISNLSKEINYQPGERPLRSDFKIRDISDENQRQLLLPLLVQIQNLAKSKEDQVRMAVSIVQNIPFGNSDKTLSLQGGAQINYSRYPYEVLYDNEGVCGEKSELLAFLMKEMGYGVVFFYNQDENHESIGVKCPVKYSLDDTGYCFVETTGPAIMTDNGIEYAGGIKLTSKPEVILVSNGDSLGSDMYEYQDAKEMDKIRNGGLMLFKESQFDALKKKYGLAEVYNP